MKKTDDKDLVVMRDDDAAAKLITVTGWVSRHGNFYGDKPGAERTARYDGCTHVNCSECEKPVERMYTKCQECRCVALRERYNQLPKAKWDGSGMLAIYQSDEYFQEWEYVLDYAEENEIKVEDLLLVICEPNYVRKLDYDYAHDELPEGGENPDLLNEAIEAFNLAIEKIPAISYSSWGEVKALILEDGSA